MTLFPPAQEELEGELEGITFSSEESGFTVARLNAGGRPVTIAGCLRSVCPGETLKLRGRWQEHPKYGLQFKFESYEPVVPATIEGIERYLGSFIKGIGPVTAKRIIKKFGLNALDVIENSISRLREVEGIGESRIGMIENAWARQKEIKEVMVFLQGHGVSSAYASRIFRHYGRGAIGAVRENPYRLASEVSGIGFLTADRIAEKLGIGKDSPRRAEAGVLHVLEGLFSEGNAYYPYEPLLEECAKVLGLERQDVAKALARAALDGKLVIEAAPESSLGENEKAVFLSRSFAAETGIAERLLSLLASAPVRPKADVGAALWEALGEVQRERKFALSEKQKAAVAESFQNKVFVITGGPGTGKTTIIDSIVGLLSRLGMRVLLSAPTGRAAKRMAEATGTEAKTMHRLLEWSPRQGGFRRNEFNPLEADFIIIDETSMVDAALMHQLLRAVPPRASLLLVGDADQLPSIGAGNVLNDIIGSGKVPSVRLSEIFRQSGESLIVTNAHRVNRGEMPLLGQGPEESDFYFIELADPEAVLKEIVSLCSERLPRKFGLHPVRDIQVISAMHKGTLGTASLNRELQRALNPSTDTLSRGERVFKNGDKVMQVVNNYDRDVFNGDIGSVKRIDRERQEMTVDFDGTEVPYNFRDLDELVPAYAVSVHKSQGSEYPAVVMPVHTQQYILLGRNLLYTGITRGKRLVVLVGTKKAIAMAVGNDRPVRRYTALKKRLAEGE